MPDPTARPAVEHAEDGRFVVSCPTCGWVHHARFEGVAERLRRFHRCAYYPPKLRAR